MANISTNLSDWSATAGSNQPDSSDTNTIQADLQAIQAGVKGAFPNVTGAVTPTHTELNYVDGVTSAIQTQLNAKAAAGANSDITSLTGLTTPLTVAQGGTGAATHAANNVLLGNGTSAPQAVAPGTSGNVLTSNGTTWQSTAPASVVDASETAKGIVELATTAEAVTGTDTARAVTPAGLKAATDALDLSTITLGAPQATTSGTTKDFAIPAGTKQITITFSEVSFTGNTSLGVRIGAASTPDTSGYICTNGVISATTTSTSSSTAGFLLTALGLATEELSGNLILTKHNASSNIWVISGNLASYGSYYYIYFIGGRKALSGELDIVRIYGGTFDNGAVNVAYA